MTAASSNHDELREQAALYVLDALDAAERASFETHLATCAECAAEVRVAGVTAAALAEAVPQIDPSPALRHRVLSSLGGATTVAEVTPERAGRPLAQPAWPWLAAAASLAVAVGAGWYAVQLRGQVESLTLELRAASVRAAATEREIANLRRVAYEAQVTVRVIAAPDLRRSDLAGQQPVAPQASARAFWSRSRGLVFSASDLPPLPAGWTYQLWIVTSQTAVSAGVFEPDTAGRVEAIIGTPLDVPSPIAMAVTIEPAGGVPAPTGAKYLVGTVSGK